MKEFFKYFLRDFFYSLGIAWLIIKLSLLYYPTFPWLKENFVFYIILDLSCLFSFLRNYPSHKAKITIPGTDAKLIISYGDILKSKNNIVITTSNFFNTSPSIISPKSLLGQYISKNLSGDNSTLDKDITNDLKNTQAENVSPTRGKDLSYPVGTVACFKTNNNMIGFLIAILKIKEVGGDETFKSTYYDLLKSLEQLWDKIALKADDGIVDMPAIGSGIARNFGRSFDSVLLISYSFIIRARNKRPCSVLRIFLRKEDFSLSEYVKLKEAIKYFV